MYKTLKSIFEIGFFRHVGFYWPKTALRHVMPPHMLQLWNINAPPLVGLNDQTLWNLISL